MAYNYSKFYLNANADLVQKLVQLAKDKAYAQATFERPEDAGAFRFKVSNLLASLALNQPDMAWVRRDVRTWIKIDTLGRWEVNIGIPPMGVQIRGSKPSSLAATVLTQAKPVDEMPRIFEVADDITKDNFPTIWMKVMAATARESVEFIHFTRYPGADATAWIARELDPRGFEMIESAGRLVLKRVRFVPLASDVSK